MIVCVPSGAPERSRAAIQPPVPGFRLMAAPPVDPIDLLERLLTAPGRRARLTPRRARPGSLRPQQRLAGLGSTRARRRRCEAVTWPGRGSTRWRPPSTRTPGRSVVVATGHRVRQVAGLPAAGADGAARGRSGAGRSRCHRALPRADQGAGRRPAARTARAGSARSAGGDLRRRHPARGARLGARARRLRA